MKGIDLFEPVSFVWEPFCESDIPLCVLFHLETGNTTNVLTVPTSQVSSKATGRVHVTGWVAKGQSMNLASVTISHNLLHRWEWVWWVDWIVEWVDWIVEWVASVE